MGPTMEHQSCYTVYITKNLAEHISETVKISTEYTNIPGVPNQEASTNASLDLIKDTSNPSPASTVETIGVEDFKQPGN